MEIRYLGDDEKISDVLIFSCHYCIDIGIHISTSLYRNDIEPIYLHLNIQSLAMLYLYRIYTGFATSEGQPLIDIGIQIHMTINGDVLLISI